MGRARHALKRRLEVAFGCFLLIVCARFGERGMKLMDSRASGLSPRTSSSPVG
jgi:hypothetical protein